eukprot:6085903-Amphidinium_carterae.1
MPWSVCEVLRQNEIGPGPLSLLAALGSEGHHADPLEPVIAYAFRNECVCFHRKVDLGKTHTEGSKRLTCTI